MSESEKNDAPEVRLEDAMAEHRAREEFGITTAVPGTWMPEAAYRPVPVVWLGGAFVLQLVQLTFFTVLLANKQPLFTAIATGLVSLLLAGWTWKRGLSTATLAWRVVTLGTIAFLWFWAAGSALTR